MHTQHLYDYIELLQCQAKCMNTDTKLHMYQGINSSIYSYRPNRGMDHTSGHGHYSAIATQYNLEQFLSTTTVT